MCNHSTITPGVKQQNHHNFKFIHFFWAAMVIVALGVSLISTVWNYQYGYSVGANGNKVLNATIFGLIDTLKVVSVLVAGYAWQARHILVMLISLTIAGFGIFFSIVSAASILSNGQQEAFEKRLLSNTEYVNASNRLSTLLEEMASIKAIEEPDTIRKRIASIKATETGRTSNCIKMIGKKKNVAWGSWSETNCPIIKDLQDKLKTADSKKQKIAVLKTKISSQKADLAHLRDRADSQAKFIGDAVYEYTGINLTRHQIRIHDGVARSIGIEFICIFGLMVAGYGASRHRDAYMPKPKQLTEKEVVMMLKEQGYSYRQIESNARKYGITISHTKAWRLLNP